MESFQAFKDYAFRNEKLLQEALTHKSIKSANGFHNEKLEFLGDAVLNLAISHILMDAYPHFTEGNLTKLRGGLVSGHTLGEIAYELEFQKHLKVERSLKKDNPRLLADALEAYIGAVYLDSDFQNIKEIIKKIFEKRVQDKDFSVDYKSHLQEWCQKKYKKNPHYKLTKETGLEHKKIFTVEVWLETELFGTGYDHRKKQAEQMAAQSACEKLEIKVSPPEEN